MKKTRARLVAAAAITTIGAGVAVLPAIGFSASTTLTATSTTTTATAAAAAKKARADHTARRAAYETALAAELGIDVAKLRAAEKAAREKVFIANLPDMVTQGMLTADEAAALRTAQSNGTLSAAVKELRLAKLKARLDQDVTDERLTQAEADQILADARQRSTNDDGGLGFGPGGGDGDGGGHRGGRGGGPRP
jgi:hypothetical protein